MQQYLNLIKEVLNEGESRDDRTNTGTLSKFGTQSRYDLRDGFPLLTTKKMFFKGIVHEMLWFIKGDTNIKYLVDNNVNIWNEWPFELYKKSEEYKNESLQEYVQKIKNDLNFAKKYGELGPVYGKQWRNFNGVDQFSKLIGNIKNNPYSRRHIITAWNPSEVDDMALPPCHSLFQFYVSKSGYLDLQLYQRSGDIFLGVPFNIASYSLLLILVSLECKLKPRYFIHTIGDAHIYSNHLEQVKLQITREPLKLSKVEVDFEGKNIFDIKFEDIKLLDYVSHPQIKGDIAV
ncbi:thymidylate synthase [Spiroplasma turonicum]|uniref:Thymidylate synthase n=1 Tax=Spiroplasma turonicum TaxID=216946 RepID=A0A0K1P6L7_9MOLU|nr:thymidylate synthase [Spiroplasma turonicum]AKU79502.1 thymidylate synthase [Spiroplasma turonicum]ALX70524.1 thymidylate synthase [Spiroplasma turonicum]